MRPGNPSRDPLIVGGYGIQTLFREQDVIGAFAFAPVNLAPGRWETAITAIFLHGNWSHALMNAAFALAFATPVARYFGPKLGGGLLFFAFYVLTGVLANLGYAAVHPGGQSDRRRLGRGFGPDGGRGAADRRPRAARSDVLQGGPWPWRKLDRHQHDLRLRRRGPDARRGQRRHRVGSPCGRTSSWVCR